MKTPRLRSLLTAALFIVPAIASAHPGHDGDHDFVWDFDHVTSHPLATIACLGVLAAAGWAVSRLVKGSPAPREQRARRR